MISVLPAFPKDPSTVCVAYATDARFVPCTSVSVLSLREHADPERSYDVVILGRDLSEDQREKLRSLSCPPRFSVRVAETDDVLGGTVPYTENRADLTTTAYYRLFLPWILEKYEKVLYLDGDTLAFRDVAALFDTELGENLVAAVPDYDSFSDNGNANPEEYRYRRDTLRLHDINGYFNSGVLLMNAKEFRREFSPEHILEMILMRQWRAHDQDVLNVLCDGKVTPLNWRWNYVSFFVLHTRIRRIVTDQQWHDYLENWEPWIRHYISQAKPWTVQCGYDTLAYWRMAERSPFAEELYRASETSGDPLPLWSAYDMPTYVRQQVEDGNFGMRGILSLIPCWIRSKFGKFREKTQ